MGYEIHRQSRCHFKMFMRIIYICESYLNTEMYFCVYSLSLSSYATEMYCSAQQGSSQPPVQLPIGWAIIEGDVYILPGYVSQSASAFF